MWEFQPNEFFVFFMTAYCVVTMIFFFLLSKKNARFTYMNANVALFSSIPHVFFVVGAVFVSLLFLRYFSETKMCAPFPMLIVLLLHLEMDPMRDLSFASLFVVSLGT